MDTVVIGLGYKARNGKDEAARTIMAERGRQYDIQRYGFGDLLKMEVTQAIEQAGDAVELVHQMNNALPSWVQLEADVDMTDPLCPYGKWRTLLQWWGGEYRRSQDPEYWVKRLAERIREDAPEVALISDMRYPNESFWVKRVGGFIVRVRRLGFTPINEHISETAFDGMEDSFWDFRIDASEGAVDHLRSHALLVFDTIAEKTLGARSAA